MTKELLTIAEVCTETSIGKTMVYKLINSGQLLAVKLGKKTLVRRADLLTWLTSLNSYASKKGRAQCENQARMSGEK